VTEEYILSSQGTEIKRIAKNTNGKTQIKLEGLTPYKNYEEGLFTINNGVNNVKSPAFKTKEERGVILDVARRYYSLSAIKIVVDTIAAYGGEYLQLHFSDNDGFTIASDFLGQNDATLNNGKYLTKDEVSELVRYCSANKVMIIPDFDMPAHSKGWLDLLTLKDPTLATTVKSDFSDSVLNYWDYSTVVEALRPMIEEVAKMFRQTDIPNQRFNIGGDEVAGASSSQDSFVNFMNHYSDVVESQGYKVTMWNDCLKSGLPNLKKNIGVLYWKQSYTSEGNDYGLTAQAIGDAGYNLYNCNFYSLVFLPQSKFEMGDIEWQQDFIVSKYKVESVCHYDNTYEVVETDKFRGTALTFWSEGSIGMTEQEVLDQIIPLIETYLKI